MTAVHTHTRTEPVRRQLEAVLAGRVAVDIATR